MSHARDRPKNHYSIEDNGDGTVDVYLSPDFCVYRTRGGAIEYDATLYVMRGVEKFDGLEDDIRRRFYAWLESAERIEL
ncbi:MAG: hypothetical protein PHI27_06445 [Eubacteriales bacterium]|nr:hypothetical protein [Eubacteriales bacterium]MDD3881874.1 hypothetical protein [Eubacteriales bacterium]MDD4512880.1 hypothetical protein [Eubacteriales bacterium]